MVGTDHKYEDQFHTMYNVLPREETITYLLKALLMFNV